MKIFDVYSINNIEIVSAKGTKLIDNKGVEYLDMYGGHAVISIGHTNDRYVSYLTKQLSSIGFYSNSIVIPQQQLLADRLSKLTGKIDYQLFLCNSGAEANENAIKTASFHNGRSKIISFSGGFHGRTSLAVAATDNPKIVAPINKTDNVVILPFNDIDTLKAEFAKDEKVCAVIFEAIQGVGGVVPATKEFASVVRDLCDEYGAVMIADCVQCGCGRTGKYFALDNCDVVADIYTMAKGIGNGFPIAGILISPNIKPFSGMLGTTFGGNHLACSAALAVADEMLDKQLINNAKVIGEYLIEKLKNIKCDKIVEIRGIGLMIAIRFSKDAKYIKKELLERYHIFTGGANDPSVMRILPSLTVITSECDYFVDSLKAVIYEKC